MLRNLRLTSELELLDFGAGTGLVVLQLAPHVRKVIAYDTSPGMLKVLQGKLGSNTNVEPMQGTPGQAEPRLPTVDVVVSAMALHHVADIAGVARAFKAALRPGGQLAVADLDPEGGAFHADRRDVMHDGFEREALAGIFAEAGFQAVACHDACTIIKPAADGRLRPFTIFLLTGVLP
jgi:2-polyprenyl-3-methyl-5-hydroxy-6-metoxy-1,4-benzoquinol methylase